MKRYIRLMLALIILSFPLFMGVSAGASNNDQDESSIVYINGKSINETRFKDGILKREVISCYKYDYGDDIPKDTYQYVIVRAEVTYVDGDGVFIASAYIESTFRYNKRMRLSKCLSTSHGQSVNSDKYSLEVFGRTKNLSLSIGESFGKITLSNCISEKDLCKYVFSCDKDGNLLRCIV